MCQECRLPALAPANALVWSIFVAVHSQFSHDFHVNPLEVMELFGVAPPRRARLLKQLGKLYDVAQKNQKRAKDGQ